MYCYILLSNRFFTCQSLARRRTLASEPNATYICRNSQLCYIHTVMLFLKLFQQFGGFMTQSLGDCPVQGDMCILRPSKLYLSMQGVHNSTNLCTVHTCTFFGQKTEYSSTANVLYICTNCTNCKGEVILTT